MGFAPEGDEVFYRGEGCDDCFHTGYRGRIGAFEILNITPDLRRAIHSGNRREMEAAVERANLIPIMENCRELIRKGVTTTEEVTRVIGI